MATVYLGEDPLLNRLVAIKVIQAHLSSNDKLIERFTVEAKTIASLRHVNIVEIFDFGFQEDQQFLVMEYIDGQNLQTLCTAMAGRPMPDTVVAAIIYQAAEGLTSAEKHGVVHRDIKPENLLFNSAGVLKIADLGSRISPMNNQEPRPVPYWDLRISCPRTGRRSQAHTQDGTFFPWGACFTRA